MVWSNRSRRSVLLGLVALAVLGLPACVPTTWLRDSSGFVYINPVKGKKHGDRPTAQLVHFDINKKESRVVVADLGVDGGWPAVSPDGKQIAVARIEGQPHEARTVQIAIYDFDGKKVKESEASPWTAKPEEKKSATASDKVPLVFWSPRNDMLVVSDFETSGFFNLHTDALKVFTRAIPVIHGGTPIPPDGRGCLMALGNKEKGKPTSMVFMEWDGTKHVIDTQPLEPLEPKHGKDVVTKGPVDIAMIIPIAWQSWWDANTAFAGLKGDKVIYDIDTLQKTSVVSAALRELVAANKKLGDGEQRDDFAGDVSVKVTHSADNKVNKVVVVNYQSRKEHVLVENVHNQVFGVMAPDGKNLASACIPCNP